VPAILSLCWAWRRPSLQKWTDQEPGPVLRFRSLHFRGIRRAMRDLADGEFFTVFFAGGAKGFFLI